MEFFEKKRAYYRQKAKPKMPTDGLVFYAPLDVYHQYAETGQNLVYSGQQDMTFGIENGVPCVTMSSSPTYIYASTAVAAPKFTVSCWMMTVQKGETRQRYLTFQGQNPYSAAGPSWTKISSVSKTTGKVIISWANSSKASDAVSEVGAWDHIAIAYADSLATLYVNGEWAADDARKMSNARFDLLLNAIQPNAYYSDGVNRYAALRGYGRVLSQSEIQQLAKEFTPTP